MIGYDCPAANVSNVDWASPIEPQPSETLISKSSCRQEAATEQHPLLVVNSHQKLRVPQKFLCEA
jgi:hypothetical protein